MNNRVIYACEKDHDKLPQKADRTHHVLSSCWYHGNTS